MVLTGGKGGKGGMVDEYSAESRLSVGFSVLWLLQLVRCRDRSKVHSCSSNSQVRYGKIILHYLSPAASFAPRRKRTNQAHDQG